MPGRKEETNHFVTTNPRFMAAIDNLLVTGVRLGPLGKQAAINKVLYLLPQWTRGDCWRRIRQLRDSQENEAPNPRVLHDDSPGERNQCPMHRTPTARWTPADNDQLLNLAGYEPVRTIAQRLGRSVSAVRFRLGALGVSARVSDGWSQRAIRELLHISPATFRYLVGSGMLKVRDSRVTATSVISLIQRRQAYSTSTTLLATLQNDHAYSWERAADILEVSVRELQNLICSGRLKVMDTFVREKAFEDFCRKHGEQINMVLIDRATADWLVQEYGVPEHLRRRALSRAQKHASLTRTCVCGKRIAGNAYFRHAKHCHGTLRTSRVVRQHVPFTAGVISAVLKPSTVIAN
jgi:hypothetical protein